MYPFTWAIAGIGHRFLTKGMKDVVFLVEKHPSWHPESCLFQRKSGVGYET